MNQDNNHQTTASVRYMLASVSQIEPSEIEHWDHLAAHSDHPDASSCGSAWQITAFENSRRHASAILFRQTKDSQIVFSLVTYDDDFVMYPLEAHWSFGSPLIGVLSGK